MAESTEVTSNDGGFEETYKGFFQGSHAFLKSFVWIVLGHYQCQDTSHDNDSRNVENKMTEHLNHNLFQFTLKEYYTRNLKNAIS